MTKKQTRKRRTRKACYARNHMDAYMHLVYTCAIKVSYNSKVFYVDGRAVADEYVRVGKDAVYTAKKRLVAEGWFIELARPRRLETGVFASGEYRVLTHDEWSRTHEGQCRTDHTEEEIRNENQSGTEDCSAPQESVRTQGTTSPDLRNNQSGSKDPHQSGFKEQPVRDPGHSYVKRVSKEGESKESGKRERSIGKGAASSLASPSSQNPPARPVSTKRMTDAELSREFERSSRYWAEYNEFVSTDPEGWDSLKNRRKKVGEDAIAWIRSLYFFSQPKEREMDQFIGSLLTLKATDDELTVRPDGSSLIQVGIEEAIRKGKNWLFDIGMYLHDKFPAIRATYNKKHSDQSLEKVQPVEAIQ